MSGISMGKARLVHKTDKAVLVHIFDHDGGHEWVPLKVIHDDSEIYDETRLEDEGEFVIGEWFAEKKGWA